MRGTLQLSLHTFLLLLFFAPALSAQSLSNTDTTADIASQVIINEFLADPAGDANGDGTIDKNDDEFIEIINIGNADIDISGWKIFDNPSEGQGTVQYTFPAGTVLPAERAVVVFGGGNPAGSFGGAIVKVANGLSLDDSGDAPALLDKEGKLIQLVRYGASGQPEGDQNQSLTRDPDIVGNFFLHSGVSESGGALFSPGTSVDGTAFGSTFAFSFRGGEGYRFVGTPSQNTTFNNFFADFWTQGITGSDAPSAGPSIFGWQEDEQGGLFSKISAMDNNLMPGRGYMIYVFGDDQFTAPGLQGGFPKVISTDNPENKSPVMVPVTATDADGSGDITTTGGSNEGYNLLSNPYGTHISVAALLDALEELDPNVNANIYVWDHQAGEGNGDFLELEAGDLIAPFQAFFVRYTSEVSGSVEFDRDALAVNQGTELFDQPTEKEFSFNFEMYFGDGEKFDTYQVQFNEDGTVGEDHLDGYKLFSLNPDALSFYSSLGNGVQLAKNVLPSFESLKREGELRIPLVYNVPKSGEYSIRWRDLDEQSQELEFYLVDNEIGRKIDMKGQALYQFTINSREEQQSAQKSISPTISASSNNSNSSRFELVVVASTQQQEGEKPLEQPIVLSSNYPNPFNSQTTMDLQLREKMHVNVTVWNIVGQKVATMMDKTMDAGGPYPMTWNVPANMPSGIYICKVEAGGMVLTRKMTLVK